MEPELALAGPRPPDEPNPGISPADYVQGIFDREMGVTLNNLKAGSPRDEAMRRLTEEAANLYSKRVLRELIQNAFDGAAGGDARILIRLDLRQGDGVLLVANAGSGFSRSNVDAVASPAMSNKTPGNFIGHKGLGFRSVELLSDAVEIHSMNGPGRPGAKRFDGFRFRFADASDERAWLDARGEIEHADRVVGRVHRLQLPIPIVDVDPEIEWFAREGYATVIRLPLRDAASVEAAAQEMRLLLDEKAPITLFLDRLSGLEIERIEPDGSHTARSLTRRSRTIELVTPRHGLLVEEVTVDQHRFLVARTPVDDAGFRASVAEAVALRHPVARWGEWTGTPEVSIALPLAGEARPGVFYAFLPMDRPAPFNGCLDAPFYPEADRRDLELTNPLNLFLLDQIAELGLLLAGSLAEAGETRAELAAAAVDAVAWTEHTERLLAACGRIGLDPAAIRLPIMRRRDVDERWARLDEVLNWPDDRFIQIDRSWVVRICGLPILPRALRERRLAALACLAEAADCTLEPDAALWAEWAPKLAADLAKRRKLIRGDWEGFYADLAEMPDALGHLRGKPIFRLEDGKLGEANRAEAAEERELFISPSAEGATGRSRRLGSAPLPPESVAKRMVFADPGLSWPPAVATAFFKAGLASRYDLPRVLARLTHLLGRRPRQPSIVAALGWAFVAWRDHRTPEVEQAVKAAGLAVPVGAGGSRPARAAFFGAGWRDTRGEMIAEFLAAAPEAIRSVKPMREGMLADWEQWPLRERGSMADWVQFLRLLGVRDGLVIAYLPAVSRPIHEWAQLRYSDDATLSIETRLGPQWRIALRTGSPWSGIRYQSRNYSTRETLFIIPGQAEHAAMPDAAKLAYARLLVALISTIQPSLLQTTLHRTGGNDDAVAWPSPAAALLTHGEWLPVGSDDDLSWRRPSDCWYAPRGEQLPRFVPRILRWSRDGLDASKSARDVATGKLGLRLWNEPSSAPARLAHLGTALVEGIAEADYDAFRKAHREAWEDWRSLTPRPSLPEGVTLALQGSGRPSPLPAAPDGSSATIYVGDGSDVAREQLVSALGHNLLAVPTGTAADAAAALRKARADVFTLLPDAQLTISADGVPVEPRGDAAALVEPGREWLAEIAVLVLEFNDTLSSRNTVRSRRALYEAFMRLRLVFAHHVSVELDGRTGPLPGSLDGVLALPHPDHPTIIVERASVLDWSVLARLARALPIALGRPSLALAFRVTFLELERRMSGLGGRLERPSDSDVALALGHTVSRVKEVQRSLRSSNRSLFDLLIPAVHAALGPAAASALRAKEETVLEDGEVEALLVGAGADGPTARRLIAAAHGADGLDALRRELGIGLAAFNQSIVDLGQPWVPLRFEARLRQQFGKLLEAKRNALEQEVRDRYVATFDDGGDLAPYVEALSLDWVTFPDTWVAEFDELPDASMDARIDELLTTIAGGAVPIRLASLDELRQRNRETLQNSFERVRRVVTAWVAKDVTRQSVAELSLAVEQVARRVVASGVFDFREVTADAIPAALGRAGLWPAGMEATTNLDRLELQESDLDARAREEEKVRQDDLKGKRTIVFGTTPVDGGAPGRLQLVAAALDGALSTKDFRARSGPATLLPMQGGGGGGGGPGGRKPSTRDPEYSSEEQRVLLGFAGEYAAYRHLKRTVRGFSDHHWVSSMGRSFLGLTGTDDRDGYDFHIPRSKGPDLFFEVKAHTGDPGHVDLERSQVEAAIAMADGTAGIWTILYVPYVRNPDMIGVHELQNPYGEAGRSLYRQRGREAVRLDMKRA